MGLALTLCCRLYRNQGGLGTFKPSSQTPCPTWVSSPRNYRYGSGTVTALWFLLCRIWFLTNRFRPWLSGGFCVSSAVCPYAQTQWPSSRLVRTGYGVRG